MPRFFTEQIRGDHAEITGPDAVHISRVLRMKPGEKLSVCDCGGNDYACEILHATPTSVKLLVLHRAVSRAEPTVRATLYQGLPKSDKMEWIVQKSVELGVHAIVPVLTGRCVSRPEPAALAAKVERWNKIAREAAKQSGRGVLPEVKAALPFHRALEALREHPTPLMFYEEEGGNLSGALPRELSDVGFLIGPEGGFEPEEAEAARNAGIRLAGLGPRILRTETAPLCVLSALMFHTGNL